MIQSSSSSSAFALEINLFQRGYVEGGTGPATVLTDSAVKAFEHQHPDIKVAVTGVPWGEAGDLKLRTALLARKRIDLFRLSHDQLPGFIPRVGQLLSPIDPHLTPADRADFGEAALGAVGHAGQALAWPLWSTAMMLVANRQILDERGIRPPADRPWTWDEFSQVLRQASFTAPDGRRVAGLNAAAQPPLFEWAPLLLANCGPLFPDGTKLNADGSFNVAAGLPGALARLQALRAAGWVAPGFGTDDQPAAWDSFLKGRVAFLATSPAFIRTLIEKKFDFVILPPPTGDFGRPITTGALGCVAVVAGDDPARVAAAHTLARYLTSAEIAREVPGWYLAPPARASVQSFYDQPAYRPLRSIMPTAQYLVAPVSSGFLEGTIIPSLQAALLGQLPPAQAIATMQATARRQALR